MGLKENKFFDPLSWRSFAHGGWSQPEGSIPAYIHEARVIDVNLTNWTIDCHTIFDQKMFLDVQVASPYMHPARGEGMYVIPEVGAKCLICIPSDGPPPFVLAFLMPMETKTKTTAVTDPIEANDSNASFGGGRKRPKPGDIVVQGRDGNFMRLHRGGVAEFGASQLAQRICIPLGNLVTDISQNYNHFNSGGAINWGVRDGGTSNPESEYRHTIRVFADDEYADMRFAMGKLKRPVAEPVGEDGETSNLEQLGIGTTEDIVFEMVLAPGGFDGGNGDQKDVKETRDLTKLRIFFDRGGNAMARFEGAVDMRVKKRLKLTVDEDIDIIGKKRISIEATEILRLIGQNGLELGTGGGVTAINGGTKAVAYVGSPVTVTVPPGLLVTTPGGEGFVNPGQTFTGFITLGNSTILV